MVEVFRVAPGAGSSRGDRGGQGFDDPRNDVLLDDPLAALTEVGIEVAPIIKRQLKRSSGRGAPGMLQATPQSYLLPNGQVVTTTPRIRITGVRGRGA